jgi:hypothetical protein
LITIPEEWKDGLRRLSATPAPWRFNQSEWQQLIDDASYLATVWGHRLAELRWTTQELFARAPGFARRLDFDGLAMLLHGQTVTAVDEASITIANDYGPSHMFRRKVSLRQSRSFWDI